MKVMIDKAELEELIGIARSNTRICWIIQQSEDTNVRRFNKDLERIAEIKSRVELNS